MYLYLPICRRTAARQQPGVESNIIFYPICSVYDGDNNNYNILQYERKSDACTLHLLY